MTIDSAIELDPDAVKLFSFKVWTYKMGEQVSLMIYLGDRLGLYSAMARRGPLSSQALADSVKLHERFVREWLLGQAAAGLIERTQTVSSNWPPDERAPWASTTSAS